MKSIIAELMTSKERSEYLEKGMRHVKKPGKQAVTFAKQKEKKGESVTVSEFGDPDVKNFNDTLAESILLPIGSRGVFFEQDDEIMCANYVTGNKTCDVGCDNVGVDRGGRCPYLPIDTQPKCPCYMKKGEGQ